MSLPAGHLYTNKFSVVSTKPVFVVVEVVACFECFLIIDNGFVIVAKTKLD